MKRALINTGFTALFAGVVMMLAGMSANQARGGDDGKTIFLSQKCNTCHTISSESIDRTGRVKAPDLSKIGKTKDADWIKQFVTKKVELDGKKHPKKFSGADADLTTLANWLASHK